LTAGSASALAGSLKLTAGSASALSGSQALTAGSASALAGSLKLSTGSAQAFVGSKQLVTGLGAIALGEHQTAVGLPAAISGAQQIAAGLVSAVGGGKTIHSGLQKVKSAAVAPLAKQISGAGNTSLQDIAILTAGSNRELAAPGGAGRTYVLTQAPNAIKLAAFVAPSAAPAASSSNGRNILIGAVGGLLVLILGVFSGLTIGRRRTT
jgi:hypothetical protein